MTRGVVGIAGYVPYRRLQRAEVARVFGTGGGKGTRTVASYDEDTTTMGGRGGPPRPRAPVPGAPARTRCSWRPPPPPTSTRPTPPPSHAALRLGRDVVAADFGGAVRSARSWPCAPPSRRGSEPTLVVVADLRDRPAGQHRRGDRRRRCRRRAGRRRRADGPVLAEFLGWGIATEEFLDRWRTNRVTCARRSGRSASGRATTSRSGEQAWAAALKACRRRRRRGRPPHRDRHLHGRAVGVLSKRLAGLGRRRRGRPRRHRRSDRRRPSRPAAVRPARAGRARPLVALVSLADGADVLILRTTAARGRLRAGRARRRAAGRRRAAALRQVPLLAGLSSRSSRPGAPSRTGSRRRPPAGRIEMEVRVRRALAASTGGTSAAVPPRGSARRATGADPHGRRPRDRRHLHGRPAVLLAESAGRLRGRRLRRGRSACRSN